MAEASSPAAEVTCLTDLDLPHRLKCRFCLQGWRSQGCQNKRTFKEATPEKRAKWRAERKEEEELASGRGARRLRRARPRTATLVAQDKWLNAGSEDKRVPARVATLFVPPPDLPSRTWSRKRRLSAMRRRASADAPGPAVSTGSMGLSELRSRR